MALPEPRSAAREPTAAVSVVQSAPQCGRDRARPRGNLHHAPIATVVHHHTARVTREAPGRFRGNARAVLERGLARGVRVLEHRSVGLLLRHGRRFRGNVRCAYGTALCASPLIQRLARRDQSLREHCADLGRQPPADHDHAVVALIHVELPACVPPRILLRLGLAVHASPAAHDALDMVRCPGASRAWPSRGNVSSACATRTRSRAAPMSRPTRHSARRRMSGSRCSSRLACRTRE